MAKEHLPPSGAPEGSVALPDQGREREGLPTGENTTSRAHDVADPHPSNEEDYDKIPHPGGANPPDAHDIGPNSYAHDGKSPPRPKSKGSMPQ